MTIRHHIYRVMTVISLHLVPNILLQPQAQHILCQTVVMRAGELLTIRAICLFVTIKACIALLSLKLI